MLDATQAAGATSIDVATLQPDFLAFPTYKWLLGSYNLAFLYAASQWHGGEPLDRNGFNCKTDAACLDIAFPPGARRYDMGERNNPVALPMAEAAMSLTLQWGLPAIEARLRHLTNQLEHVATRLGLTVPPHRAPNIIGMRLPGGGPLPPAILEALAARNVHVSDRQGTLRVSPHLYNDETDIERFAATLGPLLGS